jgi:hypothetical protein
MPFPFRTGSRGYFDALAVFFKTPGPQTLLHQMAVRATASRDLVRSRTAGGGAAEAAGAAHRASVWGDDHAVADMLEVCAGAEAGPEGAVLFVGRAVVVGSVRP